MADINVERKGPSIWPWIIGLLVLALLIWAIAEMVDTEEPEVAERVEEVEQPPAAVPAPMPQPDTTAATLGTLLPLGPEDVGQRVLIAGEVVGTPVSEGFWVRSDEAGNHVLFVQAPATTRDGQTIEAADLEPGRRVEIVGTIQQIPPDRAMAWIDRARLRDNPQFAQWNVRQDMMVGPAQAGMRAMPPTQQPGQQMRPGDTVQGRY